MLLDFPLLLIVKTFKSRVGCGFIKQLLRAPEKVYSPDPCKRTRFVRRRCGPRRSRHPVENVQERSYWRGPWRLLSNNSRVRGEKRRSVAGSRSEASYRAQWGKESRVFKTAATRAAWRHRHWFYTASSVFFRCSPMAAVSTSVFD